MLRGRLGFALILGVCPSGACVDRATGSETTGAGASEDGPGTGNTQCGAAGTHSQPYADHQCICEPLHDWCSPADPEDFSCCPDDNACVSGTHNQVTGDGLCMCDPGYEWTFPADDSNLDCVPIGP